MNETSLSHLKIAIIGLGYVGLPLARLFALRYPVTGFDVDDARVRALNSAKDVTGEIGADLLSEVLRGSNPTVTGETGLFCTTQVRELAGANVYIIAVPTPIDHHNHPDLRPLYAASETVGKVLKKGDLVIYESTVYPGVTEEEGVPVLERTSGLKFNTDFFCGYSPERINPGDREHTLEHIIKLTSGSTPEAAQVVNALYASVIPAGTHPVSSIRVAEAAKVIENAQRDLNIAFVNELAKIFALMGLQTSEVLEAAGTKWNFMPFKPGLVGGHCIGVDPFYLAQKAQEFGYYSELILTARRVNDSMGTFIAHQVIKAMIKKSIQVNGAQVLLMGVTFKENCADIRNTKSLEVAAVLEEYGAKVTLYDPHADPAEVKKRYGRACLTTLPKGEELSQLAKFDAAVLTVAHHEFSVMDLSLYLQSHAIVYDVKSVLPTADFTL